MRGWNIEGFHEKTNKKEFCLEKKKRERKSYFNVRCIHFCFLFYVITTLKILTWNLWELSVILLKECSWGWLIELLPVLPCFTNYINFSELHIYIIWSQVWENGNEVEFNAHNLHDFFNYIFTLSEGTGNWKGPKDVRLLMQIWKE